MAVARGRSCRRAEETVRPCVMISVVIPTLNAETHLPACMSALVPAAVDGLVKEVIVTDGGSADQTWAIADDAGAKIIRAPKGRGSQLAAGADAARSEWFLFLHADTALDPSWAEEIEKFLDDKSRAGVFTLRFDAKGLRPKLVAWGAMMRTRIFALPYGDQGLLISRSLYQELGGYNRVQLFEDVDFIERLVQAKGREALHIFDAAALTSAERYERNGYVRQVLSNFIRLMRYKFGAAPEAIAKKYSLQ